MKLAKRLAVKYLSATAILVLLAFGRVPVARAISNASNGSRVAGVSRNGNNMEVFWIDLSGAVNHAFWNGGDWGGIVTANPGATNAAASLTAVSRDANYWEVFYPTTAGVLNHVYWENPNQYGPYAVKASINNVAPTGGISAVSRDTNYIDVFYVTPAPNPMIMHVYWISGSGWSDPIIVASANVLPNTSIAAISRKSNTIEVFWVGNDYSIQHAYWYDTIGWAGPFALTNPNTVDGWSAQPDLAVVSRNPYDKLEVFFRGREMYQKLHHVYWSEGVPENGFWSGKTQIPGSIYAASGKLAAISRASDAIEVFFHGTDYEVHHTYWDGSNWNNGGIVNASESRGDALGGIAAVTRASSSTQMEAWFPTPCSRALQASYTGSNFDFTRGCRARCAWREGGGLVGLARELSRSLGLESSLAERGVDLE